MPDLPALEVYLSRWSAAHGGADPRASRLTLGWLTLVHRAAAPFVRRRVPPDALTVAGTVSALAVPAVAAPGGLWPWAAVVGVLLAAVLDGLDGAVAVLTGVGGPWGRILDPLADRVGDLAFLTALWLLGAPGPVCAAAAALTLLQESVRASAAAAGVPGVGVLTVWERPTRVVLVVLALLGAGLGSRLGPAPGVVASLSAVLAVALAGIGLVQLLVSLRRRVRGPGVGGSGAADEVGDDARRQGDEGQPAPGVRGAADEEEPRDR